MPTCTHTHREFIKLFFFKRKWCSHWVREFENPAAREKIWKQLVDSKIMMYLSLIHPVHPKGDQSCMFIGRTDAEAKAPILWPPKAKNRLTGKDPDAGKYWGQEEKGMTEDEMVGWHHWLSGHESEWAPGVGDGQGGQACCGPRGRKELDTTEWLNWLDRPLFPK